jgi:hypothetical protein
VNGKTLMEIEYFFKSYNKLEGRKFKVLGQSGRSKALRIIKKSAKEFTKIKVPSNDWGENMAHRTKCNLFLF